MTTSFTIEKDVHFQRHARGRQELREGNHSKLVPEARMRVPRVARLMALAIRFEEQVRTGVLASYSRLADLGHVSRARVSQIMNLVNLAPDLQEVLLFLPRTERGHDPIHLRLLQPIASALDWKRQRRLWHELVAGRKAVSGTS